MMIRVVIVDEHIVFRRGLHSLLAEEDDIEVVGELEQGPAAVPTVLELRPDVVLLDSDSSGAPGTQLAQQLQRARQEIRVILLASHGGSGQLSGALGAGVHGYLFKRSPYRSLAQAIRTVIRGERVVAPELVSDVIEAYSALAQASQALGLGLTDVELQVLRLIADGHCSQRVADQMAVSEVTVKRKLQEAAEKLQAKNRVHAVATAIRSGLI